MDAKAVVIAYWQAMQSNDFYHASEWLSEDFTCDWPQSAERIKGRENFAAINSAYPANGRWQFEVKTIVAEGTQVVTNVAVTDGVVRANAITFHIVKDGLIHRQTEYWPDDYPAPEWRSAWVETLNVKE